MPSTRIILPALTLTFLFARGIFMLVLGTDSLLAIAALVLGAAALVLWLCSLRVHRKTRGARADA